MHCHKGALTEETFQSLSAQHRHFWYVFGTQIDAPGTGDINCACIQDDIAIAVPDAERWVERHNAGLSAAEVHAY